MREINHLRRIMREKPGKGGLELGKAGPFSHSLPAFSQVNPPLNPPFPTSAHISVAVLESREATADISQAQSAWKIRPKTFSSRRDGGSSRTINSYFHEIHGFFIWVFTHSRAHAPCTNHRPSDFSTAISNVKLEGSPAAITDNPLRIDLFRFRKSSSQPKSQLKSPYGGEMTCVRRPSTNWKLLVAKDEFSNPTRVSTTGLSDIYQLGRLFFQDES